MASETTSSMKTFHFISHTHWDREWYLPFESFRYKLVQLIDKLLALLDRDERFRHFHLDGQTILLEDYFTLRPGNKQRLEQHIRSGRVLIGPWYQQNDLFLTSGESTVRNLIEGIGAARKLGGAMMVGYLPDHFGLIGQMPQIFRGVGIDNSVFGRGYDSRKAGTPLFRWRSPDGSEVDSVHLFDWYNNAQRLPAEPEEFMPLFRMLRSREEAVNPSGHHVMMNGVDHLEAQEELPDILEKLQAANSDASIVHGTLPGFIAGVKAHMRAAGSHVREGELREGDEYSILAGTLSSRIYLKQANAACHDLLEKEIEPLSAWLRLLELDAYDSDTTRYLWKLLMENHPHDSICGCSQDSVHAHMKDRFRRVLELGGDIVARKLEIAARQIDEDGFGGDDLKLLLINTSQLNAVRVERTTLYFMEEDDIRTFRIEDSEGRSVPYRIESVRTVRRLVTSPINLGTVILARRIDIEWRPDVPALGYAAFRVRPGLAGDVIVDGPPPEDVVLENDRLKVELRRNGSFDLLDKTTGRIAMKQGQFQDAGDRGDLYVFTGVPGSPYERWDGPVTIESRTSNALYEECVYRFDWELPRALEPNMTARSSETAACRFRVKLRLDREASELRIETEIDNQAADHRVRMLFPLDEPARFVLAGGQFDAVMRDAEAGKAWKREANSQPFWKWFAPVTGNGGVAVFAKGLHEYEMTDDGRTACVTLIRSTASIHLRETIPLEQDIQEDSQCPGVRRFELSARPFREADVTALYQEAERFHQRTLAHVHPIDQDRWSQGRSWFQDSNFRMVFKAPDPNRHLPRLPRRGVMLEVNGKAMLSAWKEAEDRNGLIVRLFNAEAGEASAEIVLPSPVDEAAETNLLEERLEGSINFDLTVDSTVRAVLPPKKIVTYRVTLRRSEVCEPE